MTTVVGVLRGGPSREHEVSLKTGHAMASGLSPERYTVKDIYIDRAGVWHDRGRPVTPTQALRSIDVVIVGLHGEYGEDGEVQKVLEAHNVPYTGSEPFPSFLAMHKVLSKEKAKELGILTPRYAYVEAGMDAGKIAREVHHTFMQPVVVKPVRWGSSVGVSLVHGYAELVNAIESLLAEGAGGVLIEERIRGKEATAGVLEGLRGEEYYPLPPIEIIPPQNDFFSYDAKYSGASHELCPGRFSKEEKDELARIARVMHEALGLRDYSRSDFIVSPRGIYYLETNSLPAMTGQSLFPRPLEAIGLKFPDFLDHLVERALNR